MGLLSQVRSRREKAEHDSCMWGGSVSGSGHEQGTLKMELELKTYRIDAVMLVRNVVLQSLVLGNTGVALAGA